MKLQEGDLDFTFDGAISAIKFDDGITLATSSIQPVDFVIEYANLYRFVEVKDPDIPGAVNVEAFREKLKSGKLIQSLAGKYRDSQFFHRFQGKSDKDVEYVVLLSMNVLDDALLLTKQDELKRSIPICHKSWPCDSASCCVILNINQWKRLYGEDAVRRRSEAT